MDTYQELEKTRIKAMVKRLFFGVVIGGFLGLFGGGLYEFFGGVGRIIFSSTTCILFVGGVIIGLTIAKFSRGMFAPSKGVSFLCLIVLWSLSLFIPYKLEYHNLKNTLGSFEMYPGSSVTESKVEVQEFVNVNSGVSNYRLAWNTLNVDLSNSSESVIKFYENQFKDMGWSVTNSGYPGSRFLKAQKDNLNSYVSIEYGIPILGSSYLTSSMEEAKMMIVFFGVAVGNGSGF